MMPGRCHKEKKGKTKRSKAFQKYETPASLATEYFARYTKFSTGALQNVNDSNGLERHY
jgi:hypothetical protein